MEHDLRTRGDISGALLASEKDVATFFTALSSEELSLRVESAWTALEQLEHLNSAVGAVANGFAAPKIVLRFRYGRSKEPGRSYLQLRDDYRARLAAGGRASGAFIPKPPDASQASAESRRGDQLERWRRRNGRLRTALNTWSESQLDTIQMPHPLLGSLTAREMLYFAIYHAEHHVAATKRRLPRFIS